MIFFSLYPFPSPHRWLLWIEIPVQMVSWLSWLTIVSWETLNPSTARSSCNWISTRFRKISWFLMKTHHRAEMCSNFHPTYAFSGGWVVWRNENWGVIETCTSFPGYGEMTGQRLRNDFISRSAEQVLHMQFSPNLISFEFNNRHSVFPKHWSINQLTYRFWIFQIFEIINLIVAG